MTRDPLALARAILSVAAESVANCWERHGINSNGVG
jgi:hypothetical protein